MRGQGFEFYAALLHLWQVCSLHNTPVHLVERVPGYRQQWIFVFELSLCINCREVKVVFYRAGLPGRKM